MLKYPRLVIDLSLTDPAAIGRAAFLSANVRAKIRRGKIRECWISENQLSRVHKELENTALDGPDFLARDLDGLVWKILVDRPRKRY